MGIQFIIDKKTNDGIRKRFVWTIFFLMAGFLFIGLFREILERALWISGGYFFLLGMYATLASFLFLFFNYSKEKEVLKNVRNN